MKIVEVHCRNCQAKFETLDVFPKEQIKCPSCDSEELDFTETEKEFKGCGGGCDNCSSCD